VVGSILVVVNHHHPVQQTTIIRVVDIMDMVHMVDIVVTGMAMGILQINNHRRTIIEVVAITIIITKEAIIEQQQRRHLEVGQTVVATGETT
jgi:hypothetical protein